MRQVSIALVHFPVVGRQGEPITTAVTNLDVHDLSRSARTFGLQNVFIVHPVEAQRTLIERVREHWVTGSGARRIPGRADALRLVRVVPTLESAVSELSVSGEAPELWTTAAQAHGEVCSYAEARARVATEGPPVLLIFGTGWGLAPSILAQASLRLEPIRGAGPWNHLSVRAACAISLDRLLGG
jgi:hypothetical protein